MAIFRQQNFSDVLARFVKAKMGEFMWILSRLPLVFGVRLSSSNEESS